MLTRFLHNILIDGVQESSSSFQRLFLGSLKNKIKMTRLDTDQNIYFCIFNEFKGNLFLMLLDHLPKSFLNDYTIRIKYKRISKEFYVEPFFDSRTLNLHRHARTFHNILRK